MTLLNNKSGLLAEITKIADEAGSLIMEIYEKGTAVSMKEDRSPVTEADQKAEVLIESALKKLTPETPIVAEEAVSRGEIPDVGQELFWLVDPLDGTREFLSKNGEFTVNIALVSKSGPELGVVVAPALETAWWGAPGIGAHKKTGSSVVSISSRTPVKGQEAAVASRSHRDEHTESWLQQHKITNTVSAGSSLKFCLLAEAKADYYPRFAPTMEWDIAAGHSVLKAAGGGLVQLDGSPMIYQKPEFRNTGFIAYGHSLP